MRSDRPNGPPHPHPTFTDASMSTLPSRRSSVTPRGTVTNGDGRTSRGGGPGPSRSARPSWWVRGSTRHVQGVSRSHHRGGRVPRRFPRSAGSRGGSTPAAGPFPARAARAMPQQHHAPSAPRRPAAATGRPRRGPPLSVPPCLPPPPGNGPPGPTSHSPGSSGSALARDPATTSTGGISAPRPRASTDLAVPRRPRMATPPRRGSAAPSRRACGRAGWREVWGPARFPSVVELTALTDGRGASATPPLRALACLMCSWPTTAARGKARASAALRGGGAGAGGAGPAGCCCGSGAGWGRGRHTASRCWSFPCSWSTARGQRRARVASSAAGDWRAYKRARGAARELTQHGSPPHGVAKGAPCGTNAAQRNI